jgi:uncharacterized protein YbjT (DUF2867 family)
VKPVRADFSRPAGPGEWEGLFAGATTLFLNPGGVGDATEDLMAAARAGVTLMVLLPSGAVTDEEAGRPNAIAAYHRAAERAVRAGAAAWTLLRPDAFAVNVLSVRAPDPRGRRRARPVR